MANLQRPQLTEALVEDTPPVQLQQPSPTPPPHPSSTSDGAAQAPADDTPVQQQQPSPPLPPAASSSHGAVQAPVEDIPSDFLCPIFLKVMADPMVCADGNTYEKRAIERWFAEGHLTSPLTNQTLQERTLLPNLTLKWEIAGFHSANTSKNITQPVQATVRKSKRLNLS